MRIPRGPSGLHSSLSSGGAEWKLHKRGLLRGRGARLLARHLVQLGVFVQGPPVPGNQQLAARARPVRQSANAAHPLDQQRVTFAGLAVQGELDGGAGEIAMNDLLTAKEHDSLPRGVHRRRAPGRTNQRKSSPPCG